MHGRLALGLAAVALMAGAPAAQAHEDSWTLTAEGIAAEFAMAQGWEDACASGTTWTSVPSLADARGPHAGLAYLGECRSEIDASRLEREDAFCLIYVHERLHLWRGDGWHSDDPSHPLYAGHEIPTQYFAPCAVLIYQDDPEADERTCIPRWVTYAPRRIRIAWQEIGREREARRMFRKWAKRHPRSARRAKVARCR
jgi:hypothetical protein